MFSVEKAHKLSVEKDLSVEIISTSLVKKLAIDNNSCAAIAISYDQDIGDVSILTAYNIEVATYSGAQKDVLRSFLKECYGRYPAPHSHNIKKTVFWESLSRICNTSNWCKSLIYYPVQARGYSIIILLFFSCGTNVIVSEKLRLDIDNFADLLTNYLKAIDVNKQLKTIEFYVKEVGHDIASSVQAIMAKLRSVSSGRIEGERAIIKIKEAELEIMSVYRIADTLGITVDTNYNIKSESSFIFSEIVEGAIRLCESEAKERHINILFDSHSPFRDLVVFGDDKAIQLVLIQLIMNAIKYAKGSTDITIVYDGLDDGVKCSVINIGYGIEENEKNKIWSFGYRGEKAKEMHVNGSGIGLYTVKKIVTAHSGYVGMEILGASRKKTRFYFFIPKIALLNKN